jgi:hypothetical protein
MSGAIFRKSFLIQWGRRLDVRLVIGGETHRNLEGLAN